MSKFVIPPLAVQHANARIIYGYLSTTPLIYPTYKGYIFTKPKISAVIAQAQAESALNPEAIGDKGNAKCAFQWWPGRRKVIEEGLSKVDGKLFVLDETTTMLDQTRAVLYELQFVPFERYSLSLLMQTDDPYECGVLLSDHWMRPDPPSNFAVRGGYAVDWNAYDFSMAA